MKLPMTALLLAASLHAAPALAQLPPSTRAMIDAAIASGDPEKVATVLELARSVHADDAAELDAIEIGYKDTQAALAAREAREREQQVRQAGLFDNWSGEGQIGAFRSTGNSSNTGISAGLKLVRKGIDWRHKLRALADYQRSNGVTTREQFLASYEPNVVLNDDLYAYALMQFERDVFQGYSARYAASAGLGYRVIDTPTMQLEFKGGPAWRRTERLDGTASSSVSALVAGDLDWQIAKSIALTQDASAFIEADNTTIAATTGLDLAINSALNARLSYSIEHDSAPPPGAVGTDTISRFTLVYGF
jgi:putative salt-induced outer membrane protein